MESLPKMRIRRGSSGSVRWSKFHPQGERGFDGGSADNNYGSYPADDYTVAANENTWIALRSNRPKHWKTWRRSRGLTGSTAFWAWGLFSVNRRPGDIKGEATFDAARRTAEATLASKTTLVFERDHAEFMKDLELACSSSALTSYITKKHTPPS